MPLSGCFQTHPCLWNQHSTSYFRPLETASKRVRVQARQFGRGPPWPGLCISVHWSQAAQKKRCLIQLNHVEFLLLWGNQQCVEMESVYSRLSPVSTRCTQALDEGQSPWFLQIDRSSVCNRRSQRVTPCDAAIGKFAHGFFIATTNCAWKWVKCLRNVAWVPGSQGLFNDVQCFHFLLCNVMS